MLKNTHTHTHTHTHTSGGSRISRKGGVEKIQNMCARLVLRKSKWDSATSCLAK